MSGWKWRVAVAVTIATTAACSGETEPENLLTIETTRFRSVALNANFDEKIEVSGGVAPYMFAIASGNLPVGIELKPVTGQLTGVAASPGRASFRVRVTDSELVSAEQDLEIYVTPDPLEIVTAVLSSGREGTAYSQELIARGGVPPLAWSVTDGALPAGLALSTEGELSGLPTDFGTFDFTVRVADAEATEATTDLSLFLVSLNPMITTSTIPRARFGEPYSAGLGAHGGQPPYVWSLQGGDLPPGLQLANDGSITGTPTQDGAFQFIVSVADSGGGSDLSSVDIIVVAPLVIETAALPQAQLDRPYDYQMDASGGVPPYSWSLGPNSDLPTGFSFAADGRFTGVSSAPIETSLTIRLDDSEGLRKSGLFVLRVSERFEYTVEPALDFPPVCTATTVSYQTVDIPVIESYQIEDIDVHVDFNYVDAFNGSPASHSDLRVVLFGPDGTTQTPLCGNGAQIPGGVDCQGQGSFDRDFDDDGPAVTRPDRPLSTFDGLNPQGTWRLAVAVVSPNCGEEGIINSVTLLIKPDLSTDDYVVVRGFVKSNLLTQPWLRITTGDDLALDENDLFLSATVFGVGSNGRREAGRGDDVADMVPLTWAISGAAIPGVSITADGHVQSGAITGETSVTASGGGNVVTLPLYVVPPDWNPDIREY